jgi:hypothetical protein
MGLRLNTIAGTFAVARLAPDAPLPAWIRGAFTSITRTADELSIVCDDDAVPIDVKAERGWRALRIEGPIPFEMVGVAAALLTPLAEARISIFLVSTFDTDYLLVKADVFARAVDVLREAGYEIGVHEIG